jgi:MscS family membrane protein
MKPVARTHFLGAVLLILVLYGFSNAAVATDLNPLRPADTSSPRATLRGFVANVDETYRQLKDLTESYSRSDRLYLTSEERRVQADLVNNASKSVKYLDLSGVLSVLKTVVGFERVLQLKEILDRIELPPLDDMPDQQAMVRTSSKKWRLPNTEIEIVLIEDGSRAGEYLVSAATVDRLPEFYERVKTLPYKPGLAAGLADAYRAMSSDKALTIYEAYSNSPLGLDRVIPPRWMMRLPDWARARIGGAATWQWLGFTFGLFIAALFIFGILSLGASPRRPQ